MQPINARRRWTARERRTVHILLDEGRSNTYIARVLQRGHGAVSAQCKRDGISLRRHPELRSAARVAEMFGVPTDTVCTWIARGWLTARNSAGPTVRRPYWRIHDVDVLAFLENDETWIAWVPGQIADPTLRDYASELRAGPPRWLALKVIAAQLHVSKAAVLKWINQGLLPAVKYHAYYVRAEHVAAFVPPCLRKDQP